MTAPLPEPIRILSDIHLGHDACALKDVREIRPLLEGAGTIIFNGDTAEIRAKRLQARAFDENAKLAALLEELGIERTLYITGNHDPRVSEDHHVDLCQGKLLVTHGDFLFRYVSPWSKKLRHCRPSIDALLEQCDAERLATDFDYRLEVTRQCCDILEVLDMRFSKSLWGMTRYVGQEIWPPTRLLTILDVWLRSPRLMASALERYRPQARAVVFGHIHRSGIWRKRGRLLVNTGAFLTMTKSTVAEVKGGELQVHKVNRNGREWRLEKPVSLAF